MLGLSLSLPSVALRGGGAPDTTAPTVASVTVGTQSGANLPVTITDLSENSTAFFVIVPNGATTPSAAEIIAGEASGGGAPSDSGSFAVVTDGGPYSEDIVAGLDGSYDMHLVFRDAAENVSTVTSETGITIDTVAPTATLSPADGATDVAVDANIVMTFSKAMAQQGTVVLKNVGGADIETFDLSTDGTWSSGDTVWTGNPASDFTNEASLAVRHSGLEATNGVALPAITDDTTWNFDVVAAAASIAFSDAIAGGDDPVASVDNRYSRTTTTLYGVSFVSSGTSQSIDTSFSASMLQSTKDALNAAGTFVLVYDTTTTGVNTAVEGNALGGTVGAMTQLNNSTLTVTVTASADTGGAVDVSSLYGQSAETVWRVYVVYTQTATSRVYHNFNRFNQTGDRYRNCTVFERTQFNASDATMETEIAGMAI